MNASEEARIDGIVRKILYESLEEEDIERIPHALYLFGHDKLDYPVTEEEIKQALQRRLAKGLTGFFSDDEVEPLEEQEAMIKAIHAEMEKRTLPLPPDLRAVAWQEFSYETLHALNQIMYYYSGPDLLFDCQA